MVTINYKKRIIMYPLIIAFFYLFRAIDFSPFETNFDFTSLGQLISLLLKQILILHLGGTSNC